MQASQPPSVGEDAKNPPVPLEFDLREIEGFRYRVEDVRRAVTSIAVKEARAAELKAQLLNSESLQSHFAVNTTELQLLRHDRQATHVTRIQDHLRLVFFIFFLFPLKHRLLITDFLSLFNFSYFS